MACKIRECKKKDFEIISCLKWRSVIFVLRWRRVLRVNACQNYRQNNVCWFRVIFFFLFTEVCSFMLFDLFFFTDYFVLHTFNLAGFLYGFVNVTLGLCVKLMHSISNDFVSIYLFLFAFRFNLSSLSLKLSTFLNWSHFLITDQWCHDTNDGLGKNPIVFVFLSRKVIFYRWILQGSKMSHSDTLFPFCRIELLFLMIYKSHSFK